VAYATAGAGHRRAAEAVAQALAARPGVDVLCVDLLGHVPSALARAYPATYYFLVRHCGRLWGAGFELLDRGGLYAAVRGLRRAWNLLLGEAFVRWLKAEPFDVVVSTHFLPADVFGAGKRAGWLAARLVVVVTDLHPHRFWLAPEAETVVVATEQTARACEARGIPRSRLRVLGIPTARGFHEPVDRRAVLAALGLDPQRRTLLVTSGGTTIGPFEPVVRRLLRLESAVPGRAQLIVVCGENAAAARRLEYELGPDRTPARVLGFVENMPSLMGACDLVVAKAGGLTVTEAMTAERPLILYHAIPGQERFNARYLVSHGAAVLGRTPEHVAVLAQRYLEDEPAASAMREAARSLRRPDAAEAIADEVVQGRTAS
jgi:processive 1,2-diacylglycerol beta-glucosyltransferase